MTGRGIETSPQAYARLAGILYLFIIVAGFFAEVSVRSKLIVSGDPAATATNIMAHESLFRVGGAGEILMLVKNLALLAAFSGWSLPRSLASTVWHTSQPGSSWAARVF